MQLRKSTHAVVAATATTAASRGGFVPCVLTNTLSYDGANSGAQGRTVARLPKNLCVGKRRRQVALGSAAAASADNVAFGETPNAQLRIGYRPFKVVEHAALLCCSVAIFYARQRQERLAVFLANALADAAICSGLFALAARVCMREILAAPRLYDSKAVAPDEASRFVKLDIGGSGPARSVELHYLDARPVSRAGADGAGGTGTESSAGGDGGGTARLVHCSHGFGASSLSYLTVLQGLADRLNARAVAHDNPGFGLTERPRLRYTPAGLASSAYSFVFNARAAAALMRHVRAQRPTPASSKEAAASATGSVSTPDTVLVGHSMGALTAIRLCLELDPTTTQLVLIAPAVVVPAKPSSSSASLRPQRERTLAPGTASRLSRGWTAISNGGRSLRRWSVAGLLRAFGVSLILPLHMLAYSVDFWRKGLGAAVFHGSTVDGPFIDRYRWPSLSKRWDRGLANFVVTQLYQGGEGGADEGAEKDDSAVQASDLVSRLVEHVSNGLRVLVVHGERDAVVPLRVSQRLVAAISPPAVLGSERPSAAGGGEVKLVTMASCGHIPHEEYPDEFVEAVGRWASSPR